MPRTRKSARNQSTNVEPSSSNELLDEFKKLNLKIDNLKDDIIDELKEGITKIHEKIAILQVSNDNLKEITAKQDVVILNLESKLDQLNQYGRRENLEIAGLPDSISDDKLLSAVLNIFNEIDVVVDECEISACHRLPKKKDSKLPKRTIVRFVNRHTCDHLKSKRSKLKEIETPNIYFNDNLCAAYRTLWWHCRNLQKQKRIHSYWTNNGEVTIRITEGSAAKKILHIDTLTLLFPNVSFESTNST